LPSGSRSASGTSSTCSAPFASPTASTCAFASAPAAAPGGGGGGGGRKRMEHSGEEATASGGTVGRDSESSKSHDSTAPSARAMKNTGSRVGDHAPAPYAAGAGGD
jgi:hypothetical protein